MCSSLSIESRERYYQMLQNALDRHLRMLRESGIGVERKRAEVITSDMEIQLWLKGIMGYV